MNNLDTSDVVTAKIVMRRAVIATRDALPPAARAADTARCFAQLLDRAEFANAASMLSYMSFGSEIDTRPLFDELLRRGKRLILPRISRGTADDASAPALELHHVTSHNDLVAGVWGIDEPRAGCPQVSLSEIDFALIPGVAFDRAGNRLGYGKGYYDRLLANRAMDCRPHLLVTAIAFDCQLVDHVPVNVDDQMIDLLITPLCQIPFKP